MKEDSDWQRNSQMKQSSIVNAHGLGGSISISDLLKLTEDEIEVLGILLQLPRLILESDASRCFPFSWGCKRRRRSAIHVIPSSSSSPPLPALPPPSNHPTCGGGAAAAAVPSPSRETEESPRPVKAAEAASSPATPLSFSPSEYDEKPTLSQRKMSLKRKKDVHLKKIENLTKTKVSLLREIENVKAYYDKLKAYNLQLKARKEELSIGPKVGRENPSLECGKQVQVVPASVNSSNNSMAENQQQQPLPLMLNHTSHPSSQRFSGGGEGVVQFQHASTTSLPMPSSSSSTGPLNIPDLNISPVEESPTIIPADSLQLQAFDGTVSEANKNLSRAMAAQARQRRIQICRSKSKNLNGISKPSYSCK